MEHMNGFQGRVYLIRSNHQQVMARVGDSKGTIFLRDKLDQILDRACLKHSYTDRTCNTTERKAASAKKAGLDILVRQHADICGTQARCLAELVRASFHNITCMLMWGVRNMELNSVGGQHVEPYHMSSHFNRGVVDMGEVISHGYP